VLAAYTNALFLLGVTAYIAYESVVRLLSPVEVLTREMLIVAAVGLAVNIASISLLHGHGANISVRSALAHMMADAVSSIAIVIGAVIMAVTGWKWIDPVLSIGIAGVIAVWAWGLFRDTVRILMEIAPEGVSTDDVEGFVGAEFPAIVALNRVRIWSITEDVVAFSGEAVLEAGVGASRSNEIAEGVARRLRAEFGFAETTLQMRVAE
jgi:cobalt-zinc-cadmium efflux system protein